MKPPRTIFSNFSAASQPIEVAISTLGSRWISPTALLLIKSGSFVIGCNIVQFAFSLAFLIGVVSLILLLLYIVIKKMIAPSAINKSSAILPLVDSSGTAVLFCGTISDKQGIVSFCPIDYDARWQEESPRYSEQELRFYANHFYDLFYAVAKSFPSKILVVSCALKSTLSLKGNSAQALLLLLIDALSRVQNITSQQIRLSVEDDPEEADRLQKIWSGMPMLLDPTIDVIHFLLQQQNKDPLWRPRPLFASL